MPLYRAKERLYLTQETPGHPARVVSETDPDAHMLLVGAGGYIPTQIAAQYGLSAEQDDAASAAAETTEAEDAAAAEGEVEDGGETDRAQKARTAPPATKHRTGPPQTK